MAQASPPTALASPSKEDFIFDLGDVSIKIKLNDEIIIGKVSAYALAIASPVWKKFIFPPFPLLSSEGENEENEYIGPATKKQKCTTHGGLASAKEFDFTEDYAPTLLVLLRIAHVKFKDIPQSPTYRDLLHLAEFCDKYGCVKLVQPWANDYTWFKDDLSKCENQGQKGWVRIACVFGRSAVFEQVAKKIVVEVELDEHGNAPPWLDKEFDCPFPAVLIETNGCLYGNRASGCQWKAGVICTGNNYNDNDRAKCDVLTYGFLTIGLKKAGLWPERQADEITENVNQLCQKLHNIKILGIDNFWHERCFTADQLLSKVNAISCSHETLVLAFHRQHLKAVFDDA